MIRPHAARRATGLALAGVVLLSACSNDTEPAAAPATTPASESTESSPSPSPTPDLRPVAGERAAAVIPLGGRPVLGLGSDPEPDQAAIDAAVTTVADWLDAHLDKLQREGAGLWGQMAADGLADVDARQPVTTGLASPRSPVHSARYVMSVYHDGTPRYLTAHVEVTHPDDSVDTVGLVFAIGDDGAPRLTMFGPEKRAKAAG